MASLLGKPQTIEKQFIGGFKLNRQDIENLFYLITQRVEQQNDAKLIQFTIKIHYDDKSSVLLTSFYDFKSYAEIKSRTPLKFEMSWVFLIKFNDRTAPEKQTIEIQFNTGRDNVVTSSLLKSFYFQPGFFLKVHHTARLRTY